MKNTEDFLREICPNHTDSSKWNKSELLTILDKYQALQLLQPDVSGSKCSRKCKECNKLVFDCSDFCSKRCETAYYR